MSVSASHLRAYLIARSKNSSTPPSAATFTASGCSASRSDLSLSAVSFSGELLAIWIGSDVFAEGNIPSAYQPIWGGISVFILGICYRQLYFFLSNLYRPLIEVAVYRGARPGRPP